MCFKFDYVKIKKSRNYIIVKDMQFLLKGLNFVDINMK